LPLSKSSSSQIYPILCSISEYPQYVSVIGIYHGYEKPNNVNLFLQDFTDEAIKLSEDGFIYNNHAIPFAIKAFICDAPAKSLITSCKGHTGFFACTKCMQRGKYIKARVCYPEINYVERTDENFRNRVQPEHHTGTSILETIPSINIWLFGPISHRLSKINIQSISLSH